MLKLKLCQPTPANGFMNASRAALFLRQTKVIVAFFVRSERQNALQYRKEFPVVVEGLHRAVQLAGSGDSLGKLRTFLNVG